jgi:hypothetical protein
LHRRCTCKRACTTATDSQVSVGYRRYRLISASVIHGAVCGKVVGAVVRREIVCASQRERGAWTHGHVPPTLVRFMVFVPIATVTDPLSVRFKLTLVAPVGSVFVPDPENARLGYGFGTPVVGKV